MSWNLILCLWLLRINGLFFVLNARSEIFAHFSKSSSSWQNKGERVLLKIQKKIQNVLQHSSRSEIFFRTHSILRSRILEERQGNAKGTLLGTLQERVPWRFSVRLLLSGTVQVRACYELRHCCFSHVQYTYIDVST